ncbi:hypothetical protein HX882_23935 [Pseudomonas gingeri]|uniref:Uncharacterized protein n=1 Tax=Pseudomonas gingeri TaxID=117681 RepID=A0A7Y7XFL0_9PSED|nr:hypothetical protein [Pseudomonas gingeri]NWB98947.1 hypothetical protein [Pseudomonas gingeri]
MDEKKQFAVYSDFREGFLIGVGPSLWHYDVNCAIRFESEKEARAAAGRRRSDLATAVLLKMLDGAEGFEALPKLEKAPPGTWIVTIKYVKAPGKLFYLVSGGKAVKMSTSPDDAKGYKFERDAIKAVEVINKGDLLQAETHQKTAQVLSFSKP